MPSITAEGRHEMAILATGELAREIDFYRGLNVSVTIL
jgi:hypothetical protein